MDAITLNEKGEAGVDLEACIGCGKCVKVCPADAINLSAGFAEREIHVGAVILAVGYKPFNPRKMQEFGYGRYPNVITSMRIEAEGVCEKTSDVLSISVSRNAGIRWREVWHVEKPGRQTIRLKLRDEVAGTPCLTPDERRRCST